MKQSIPITSIFCGAICCGLASDAVAQELVVQQPVVETFTISTTVVVPDRGSTLLGGVSRAADARNTTGFSPLGSSIGSERSHSTARVHVYIHDFEAMDQALLNAGRPQVRRNATPVNPHAERAYLSLMKRDLDRSPARSASVTLLSSVSEQRDKTLTPSEQFNTALQARSIRRSRVLE